MQNTFTILIIIIVTAIPVIISILLLKKVLKFINKDNIELKAKISDYKTEYGPHPEDIYCTPIISYEINGKKITKQYELLNTRKKGAILRIIVNKNNGDIITTKQIKNLIITMFILSLPFSIFILYNFLAYISSIIRINI